MSHFTKPEFYISYDAHEILTDADYQFGKQGRECLKLVGGLMNMAEYQVEPSPILKRFKIHQFDQDCPFCLFTFWQESDAAKIVLTKGFHFLRSFRDLPEVLPLPHQWIRYHLDYSE